MLNSKYKKNDNGFTLIELLVVVAIIGLLASMVFSKIEDARTKAQNTRKEEDARQITTAIEQYRDKNNTYPPYYDGVNWYCLGFPDDSCLFGGLLETQSDSLNLALTEFMPGLSANTYPVPAPGNNNLMGIAYKCTDSDCKGYRLKYFLKNAEKCNFGDTLPPIGTNIECRVTIFE